MVAYIHVILYAYIQNACLRKRDRQTDIVNCNVTRLAECNRHGIYAFSSSLM